jgi:hypothetical protein
MNWSDQNSLYTHLDTFYTSFILATEPFILNKMKEKKTFILSLIIYTFSLYICGEEKEHGILVNKLKDFSTH